jgi:hypothetical protein
MIAKLISFTAAASGVSIEPENLMPGGGVDLAKARKRQAELAARRLDAAAEDEDEA